MTAPMFGKALCTLVAAISLVVPGPAQAQMSGMQPGPDMSTTQGMGGMSEMGGTPGMGGMAGAAYAFPVAGVRPWERPAGAPVITVFAKSPAWYQRALTGISEPIPPSLRFLESQGAWYTPFNRPGMPGRYDIRGWHVAGR
jgi:hypothetical protein